MAMKNSTLLQAAILAGACLQVPAIYAQDLYKWQDADGHVHYGQSRPAEGVEAERLEFLDERADLERRKRQKELERAQMELARLRQATENLPHPSQPVALPKPVMPTSAMSYEDRRKLHAIERDIARIASSSFDTPEQRQSQVDALAHQRDLINAQYGIHAGPAVVVQTLPSPPPYPYAEVIVNPGTTPQVQAPSARETAQRTERAGAMTGGVEPD